MGLLDELNAPSEQRTDDLKTVMYSPIHPAKNLPAEQRQAYLNLVALVAFADRDFHASETQLLRDLGDALDLSNAQFEASLALVQEPTENAIEDALNTVRQSDRSGNLLLDMYRAAQADHRLDDREKQYIKVLGTKLGLSPEGQDALNWLALQLQSIEPVSFSKADERLRRAGLDPDLFKYLETDLAERPLSENDVAGNPGTPAQTEGRMPCSEVVRHTQNSILGHLSRLKKLVENCPPIGDGKQPPLDRLIAQSLELAASKCAKDANSLTRVVAEKLRQEATDQKNAIDQNLAALNQAIEQMESNVRKISAAGEKASALRNEALMAIRGEFKTFLRELRKRAKQELRRLTKRESERRKEHERAVARPLSPVEVADLAVAVSLRSPLLKGKDRTADGAKVLTGDETIHFDTEAQARDFCKRTEEELAIVVRLGLEGAAHDFQLLAQCNGKDLRELLQKELESILSTQTNEARAQVDMDFRPPKPELPGIEVLRGSVWGKSLRDARIELEGAEMKEQVAFEACA